MRRERQEFVPDHAGKGSLLSRYEGQTGLLWMWTGISCFLSRGGILSLHGRDRIPGVPVASQEEGHSTGKARRTPGSCHHSQSPPDISVHSRETFCSLHCLDFQAKDRLTPRWNVGQPCRKASWESLVGKPRGKATDPLIQAKGSVTLLLELKRKAHVQAPTRDED